MNLSSIVSLYSHQTAKAQHQLSSQSTVTTALHACGWQCQRTPLSIARKFHAERSSPQAAGNSNLSNYTIMNTLIMHNKWILLFAAHPDPLDLLSISKSTPTEIQSKTWTRFHISNTLNTSQTRGINHPCQLCHGRKYTPAPVLGSVITFRIYGNVMLRVFMRTTNNTLNR